MAKIVAPDIDYDHIDSLIEKRQTCIQKELTLRKTPEEEMKEKLTFCDDCTTTDMKDKITVINTEEIDLNLVDNYLESHQRTHAEWDTYSNQSEDLDELQERFDELQIIVEHNSDMLEQLETRISEQTELLEKILELLQD